MKLINKIKNFLKKNELIIEKIQLTIFYIFSILILINSTKSTLNKQLNFIIRNKLIKKALTFKIFHYFGSKQKSILWNLVCQELFIKRNIFISSFIVKFNIILFCIISMLNNVIILLWNLCFIREKIDIFVTPKSVPIVIQYIYMSSFCMTLALYTYFYYIGLLGLIPKYPNFLKVVIDSAVFSLNKRKFKNQRENNNNF